MLNEGYSRLAVDVASGPTVPVTQPSVNSGAVLPGECYVPLDHFAQAGRERGKPFLRSWRPGPAPPLPKAFSRALLVSAIIRVENLRRPCDRTAMMGRVFGAVRLQLSE